MRRARAATAILVTTIGLTEAASQAAQRLAKPPNAAGGLPTDAKRDAYIRDVMDRIGMPGLQTVAIKSGRVVWSKAYGNAVMEPPGPETPMKADTILNIGSVSKTFVAAAIFKELEKGRLSLDEDVNRHLPFPVRNPRWPQLPITWRMLLTHTSSIDNGDVQYSPVSWGGDSPVSLPELLRGVFVDGGSYRNAVTFADDKPGEKWSYCNYCLDLSAYALETLIGKPFHEYVKHEIFVPLHMDDTGYFLSDLPLDRLAVGYGCQPATAGAMTCLPARVAFGRRPPGSSVREQQMSYPDYPCGRAYTSAVEYAKFMSMIMNGGSSDGVRILKASSVDLMLTPSGFSNSRGWQYGVVFQAPKDLRGKRVWGHVGEDWGVATAAFFDRQTGVGAIAFGNSNDADFSLAEKMTDLTMQVMSWFQ